MPSKTTAKQNNVYRVAYGKLLVRLVEKTDLPFIKRLYANQDIMKFFHGDKVIPEDSPEWNSTNYFDMGPRFKRWVQRTEDVKMNRGTGRLGVWIVCSANESEEIGIVGGFRESQDECNTMVAILPKHQRKKLGTSALNAVFMDFFKRNHICTHDSAMKITAKCHPLNIPCQHVIQRYGLKKLFLDQSGRREAYAIQGAYDSVLEKLPSFHVLRRGGYPWFKSIGGVCPMYAIEFILIDTRGRNAFDEEIVTDNMLDQWMQGNSFEINFDTEEIRENVPSSQNSPFKFSIEYIEQWKNNTVEGKCKRKKAYPGCLPVVSIGQTDIGYLVVEEKVIEEAKQKKWDLYYKIELKDCNGETLLWPLKMRNEPGCIKRGRRETIEPVNIKTRRNLLSVKTRSIQSKVPCHLEIFLFHKEGNKPVTYLWFEKSVKFWMHTKRKSSKRKSLTQQQFREAPSTPGHHQ